MKRMLIHGKQSEPCIVAFGQSSSRPVLVNIADVEILQVTPIRFPITVFSYFFRCCYHFKFLPLCSLKTPKPLLRPSPVQAVSRRIPPFCFHSDRADKVH